MDNGSDMPAEDVYVAQLREVFDSCDGSQTGYLSRHELHELCSKLHLDDHVEVLAKQLLGNHVDARVCFDEFKEGFVSVLSETMGGVNSSDDDVVEELELDDVSKFNNSDTVPEDNKELSVSEYMPVNVQHNASDTQPFDTTFKTMAMQDSESIDTDDYDVDMSILDPPSAADTLDLVNDHSLSEYLPHDTKTGEMSDVAAEEKRCLDTEGHHLRQIWAELGVGANGFLTPSELAHVCNHIGMDDMDNMELQQLFDKLDGGGNGRVSFQEFLQGLFLHGKKSSVMNSPSRPVTSSSRHSSKLRMIPSSSNLEDTRQTPAYFLSSGYELFTALDTDSSGLVSTDKIVELWDSMGIFQGVDILQYLHFDMTEKVNLSELSGALRHELHSVEDDNAIYQAALASYEHEIKHLKSYITHLSHEMHKQKSDLADANSRISLLVREGDERQAALEKERDKEIKCLEKRYEEQVRGLQTQLEEERRTLLAQAANQEHSQEQHIERLLAEEARLKHHLSVSQKESRRLENELLDMTHKYQDLERQVSRQQQELQTLPDLHLKVEELEAERERIQLKAEEASIQRLLDLQEQNKHLKDQNDELVMEVRDMKRNSQAEQAQRMNKPDLESLVKQHEDELRTLERGISLEKHDIEESFRLEISGLEEKMAEEKQSLLDRFEEEKANLEEAAVKSRDSALADQLEDLLAQFAHEKQDLLIKHESEKNHLKVLWEAESDAMATRLKTGYEENLQHQLQVQREMCCPKPNQSDSDEVFNIDHKLQQQKEELQLGFSREKEDLVKSFKVEKSVIIQHHEAEVDELKAVFAKGTKALHGKLKEDFWHLVDEHKAKFSDTERVRLMREMEREQEGLQQGIQQQIQHERDEMRRQCEEEQIHLKRRHEEELTRLRDARTRDHEAVQTRLTTLTQELLAAEDRARQEVDMLHISFGRERAAWEREREILRENAQEDAMTSLQGQIEQEFIGQIERIKMSFDEERAELESTITLLRQELQEACETHTSHLTSETRHMHQYGELQKTVSLLHEEKKALESRNALLEGRIEQLQKLHLEAASTSGRNTASHITNNLDKETILRAIEAQQKVMEEKTAELKAQIDLMQRSSKQPSDMKMDYEILLKNNESLLASLKAVEEKLSETNDVNQRKNREAALERELEIKSNKLAEAQVNMAINNSRLTRDLHDEREKSALKLDPVEVNEFNSRLTEAQSQIKLLEDALETKTKETTKLLIESEAKSKKSVRNLEKDKEHICWQLKEMQEQLKQQLEKASKTGLLVKDLYVENSHLIHNLQLTEQKQKEAEKKLMLAEDKFIAIKEVLKQVYPVVLR